MKTPDPHDFLADVLSDLLEIYPGVLILARTPDGGAVVLAGGADSGDKQASDANFREIIRMAPDAVRDWANEVMRERCAPPAPEKDELN